MGDEVDFAGRDAEELSAAGDKVSRTRQAVAVVVRGEDPIDT